MFKNENTKEEKTTVLGITFNTEEERREYFREELRKKLPELKQMEGFPIGEDEDILNLSDPPYYTACPNPWLNDFIDEWEEEKKELVENKKRIKSIDIKRPYPDDIKSGKNHWIYNAHTYHTKVPHEITTKFIYYYTLPGDIILDSFSGTGMTGVGGSYCETIEDITEHQFLDDFKKIDRELVKGKRNVINIDLSTIASHIANIYNTKFDEIAFEKEYKALKSKLSKHKELYSTTHNSNSNANIKYTVYSQLYICNSCEETFDYYSALYNNDNTLRDMPKCPHCGVEEKKSKMTPLYRTKIDDITGETINQIEHKPIIINYSINKKRHNKTTSIEDIEKINNITCSNFNLIPNENLIDGVETKRNERYGYKKVHHFYTKRTLFFISTYLKEIENLSQKNHFLFLLTAILPKLTKLNRFMPHHGSRALVGPMANTLYLPPIFVENNFIEQLEFQFKKIVKALQFSLCQPVSQQSATDLRNIPDACIDYIFIDPPFGANIMYSELNNLSESWLKILTNNKEEVIESKGQNKSKSDYEDLMIRSLNELYRVLKFDSWMTVEFSNTSASIWNIIQNGLNKAGFVISKVDALNKTRGGLHAMIGPVAVKQDLVITCYKPSSGFIEYFSKQSSGKDSVWNFIEDHLNHLSVHSIVENSTTAIIERSPKILFDRLIAFYVQRGLPVPIDAGKFQLGLRERFIERDGMFFTNEQVQEYDKKKKENPEFAQMSLFVSSEQDGVMWLKYFLADKSLTYQDIQPQWMQALAGVRKGDMIPELAIILEENFLKDASGKWYAPDPENEADLEKLRKGRLLRLFEGYKKEIENPRTKIKEVRVEALREGFKKCYQDKDFKTIVTVGDRIPNNLLMEDEVLLQFYDIASSRV